MIDKFKSEHTNIIDIWIFDAKRIEQFILKIIYCSLTLLSFYNGIHFNFGFIRSFPVRY